MHETQFSKAVRLVYLLRKSIAAKMIAIKRTIRVSNSHLIRADAGLLSAYEIHSCMQGKNWHMVVRSSILNS
jgi:hypothetical protein